MHPARVETIRFKNFACVNSVHELTELSETTTPLPCVIIM